MRPKTKTVELDPDLQDALRVVCDTALKAAGIQALPAVRKLVEAVTAAPETGEDDAGAAG